MIYTPMTKKALQICFDAHKGQVDKEGVPYVFHPFHLAEQMDSEESICVALLHDTIEDSDYTLDDLRKYGFTEPVIEAVSLLTHDKHVPYFDYVRALKPNALARKVKLADLAHNSDATRLRSVPTERDIKRHQKYKEAIKILTEEE